MKRRIKTASRLDLQSPPCLRIERDGYDRHPNEVAAIAARVERYAKQFAKTGEIRYLMRKSDDEEG